MCECSNSASYNASACRHCGSVIKDQNTGKGRKKQFCSDVCRKAARREADRASPQKPKKPRARKCKACGGEFSLPKVQFCSEDCRSGAVRARQSRHRKFRFKAIAVRKCRNCGFLYIPNARRIRQGQGLTYCSRECYFEDHTRKRLLREAAKLVSVTIYRKTCSSCQTAFWTKKEAQKHCSTACASKHTNRRDLLMKPMPGFVCKECGSACVPLHRRKTTFCTTGCRKKYNKREARKRYGKHHRSRAKRAGVEYEPVNRIRVFERDGWRCQICGKKTPQKNLGTLKPNAPELDHRVPISLGGPHTYDNVQCACRQCNGIKGNSSEVGQMPLLTIA